MMDIDARVKPELDPGFVPAVLCHGAYQRLCESDRSSRDLVLGLERPDGTVFRHETRILPAAADGAAATLRTVERLLKFLLWQKGGSKIYVGGAPEIGEALKRIYAADGERAFDWQLIGHTVYGEDMQVHVCGTDEVPEQSESTLRLGRNLGGCRIGFDLGGSDRKCAAINEGEVVFTEEVAWDPYFQSDPEYHYRGIRESLQRAAAHLPRVDAIGGSAAGVYVANEPRAASLFRGVSEADFAKTVRRVL
ncbi:MAG: ROK family protein, partial [Lentisphaerae bacterium]|nr:ROK family protein [Lentisphaerota bacterium]